MWNFLRPWRYRFWVVCEARWDQLTVIRARTNPARFRFPWWYLVAGPFDSNEDAANSLAFWTLQLCLLDDGYESYVEQDEEEGDF